jgi:hypothetical protein
MTKVSVSNHSRVYYLEFNEVTNPLFEKQIALELLLLFESIMTPQEGHDLVIFGENESLFLFIDSDRVNKIINLTKALGVFKSSTEISTDILTKKYIDGNFERTFLENTQHKQLLNDYVIENLTPDLVLDKINEHGMSSLNILDYSVLNYSKNIEEKYLKDVVSIINTKNPIG